MDKASKEKTAFICHRGLYQFKRLPFGLMNGPAKFQHFTNRILAPYIGKFCCCYLDDIVFYSKTEDEHDGHLNEIFKTLQEHTLTLKSNCWVTLSMEMENAQTQTKIEALMNMVRPVNCRQMRSFLGLTGYYRTLVPNYAKIATPLNKLLKKRARFVWGDAQDEAWVRLRDELVSDRIMAYSQPDKPYKLFTDACDYAVGAILVQEGENGVERPITYVFKQLNGNQLWPVIEKEGFGVMYAIKKLHPYLYGAEFTKYTYQKPLKSLFVNGNRNLKVQRWSIALAEMELK